MLATHFRYALCLPTSAYRLQTRHIATVTRISALGHEPTFATLPRKVWYRATSRHSLATMTASPPPSIPPLVRALTDVREMLERARHTGDRREIEAAIERIASFTDRDVGAVLRGARQLREKGAAPRYQGQKIPFGAAPM